MRPFSIFKKENSGFFPHRLQSKKMVTNIIKYNSGANYYLNVRDTFNDDQQKGVPEESGQTEPLCCQRNSALALANIYETPTILITRRTPFAQFNFALGKSKDKEIKRLHYAIEPSWPSPVELVDFPFFFGQKSEEMSLCKPLSPINCNCRGKLFYILTVCNTFYRQLEINNGKSSGVITDQGQERCQHGFLIDLSCIFLVYVFKTLKSFAANFLLKRFVNVSFRFCLSYG